MIPRFLRPEVVPYVSVEIAPSAAQLRARLTDSEPLPPFVCAWCPGFDPTTQPPGRSHGICQACKDRLIFEAMKRTEELEEAQDVDDRDEDYGATCGAGCGYCGRCS